MHTVAGYEPKALLNVNKCGSIRCKFSVRCCMRRIHTASTIAYRAVGNWYKLYTQQRRVRRLRRVAALPVAFCKVHSSLKWGPAAV